MKPWCLALIAVVLLAGSALAADQPVKVVVDGKGVTINPPALQREGKTFIPLRSGTGAMGAHVTWNPNTQTATVVMCGQIARIKASDGAMINNSLYLPLRMMSTKLGCTVKWDPGKSTVFIEKPKTGG
jgi:hypothetical protein